MDEAKRVRPLWHFVLIAAGVALAAALVELAMGRALVSKTGRLMLWAGEVHSAENSQQVFDWYSFSHVIHGLAFYGALWLIGRRWNWTLGLRLMLAVAIEAAWEIFENTEFVVNRYRENTMALGYQGDTVFNSLGDILACALGFLLARQLGWRRAIAVFVLTEIVLLILIRDSLLLSVLMLIYPVDALKNWQAGH